MQETKPKEDFVASMQKDMDALVKKIEEMRARKCP